MSISFSCPQCQKMLKVSENLAGKRGSCPQCQQKIQIPQINVEEDPEAYLDALPTSGELQRKANRSLEQFIDEALSEPIEPVRRTILYRVGFLLVAATSLVLPLVYLGLTGLLGWAVYWHATSNGGLIGAGTGRLMIFSTLICLAPLIIGVTAILFMLKPILIWPTHVGNEMSLNRDGQPQLFHLVDKICDAVHAPRPQQITVDFRINASASYSGGMLGMLGMVRGELVLTLGLPLVAGLTLQQLAGVLAHEFGHFSQGGGMRVTYIVRSINFWFARVVYERDALDDWLEEVSEGADFRIAWMFYLTRLVVFLTRCVLWGFMMLSHMLSCWFSQQMEFDADLHEIRLAGSRCFASTLHRFVLLNVALADLMKFGTTRELKANPIRAVVAHCDEVEDQYARKVRKLVHKSRTSWFQPHPSDSARIAAAEAEDEPGIFQSNKPGTAIFRNFDKLCARMFDL